MILDEFGQPIRRSIGFITPKWMRESMLRLLVADVDAYSQLEVERRVDDLYESADASRPQRRVVGNTVTVKLPQRYSGITEHNPDERTGDETV